MRLAWVGAGMAVLEQDTVHRRCRVSRHRAGQMEGWMRLPARPPARPPAGLPLPASLPACPPARLPAHLPAQPPACLSTFGS
jgi:hypothetical protein